MKLKNKHLIKISLIVFLVSFSLVYFIEMNHSKNSISLDEISIKDVSKVAKIDAFVNNQRLYNSTLFLNVTEIISNKTVKVVAFKSSNLLNESFNYSIIGKITLYQGEIELIAQRIEKLE